MENLLFHVKYNFIAFALVLSLIGGNRGSPDKVGEKQDPTQRPHIFMVVADDLGFNDVPWHNPSVYAPTLKRLSAEGVILERNYVQPVCTPTRSAILSGRYPFEIGRQFGIVWPLMPTGLNLSLPTIPQYLKPLGYSTHAVGKWHLGFCKWAYTPTERGFDSFKGYYTGSEDYFSHNRNTFGSSQVANQNLDKATEKQSANKPHPGYDFRDNRRPAFEAVGHYSTYEFASRVEEILENSSSQEPKFVYLAFQSVHSPLQVPDNYTKPYAYIKNKNRRTYLGMVTAMDEALERIVKKLKSTGHYDNSVIIFTSDNGGPTVSGANNWPLRGNKTTLWEGGTRAAAFVHSPLLKNKGTTSKALIHATDWMSTILGIAGGVAPPPNTSGFNQWQVINGANTTIKRKEIVYNIDDKIKFSAALRNENYKILVGNPGPGEWTPPPELEESSENSEYIKEENNASGIDMATAFDTINSRADLRDEFKRHFPDMTFDSDFNKALDTNESDGGYLIGDMNDSTEYSNNSFDTFANNDINKENEQRFDNNYIDINNNENSINYYKANKEEDENENFKDYRDNIDTSFGIKDNEMNKKTESNATGTMKTGTPSPKKIKKNFPRQKGKRNKFKKTHIEKLMTKLTNLERDMAFISDLKAFCFKKPRLCLKKYLKKYKDIFSFVAFSKKFWRKFTLRLFKVHQLMNQWKLEEKLALEENEKILEIESNHNLQMDNSRKYNFKDFRTAEDIIDSGLPIRLFDIENDPEEREDLSKLMPEMVKALLNSLLIHKKDYVPPDYPPFDKAGDPKNFGGVWSPGWC